MFDGSSGGMNGASNSPNPGAGGGSYPGPTPNPGMLPRPDMLPGPTTGRALMADYWFKRHWKMLALILLGVVILGQTIFQIVYPSSRLIPGTKVDGVALGGLKYAEAADKLNGAYGDSRLEIYFGDNGAAFQTPKMSEVGIGVDNLARLQAINYPFYLRIIPGSIFWAPALGKPGDIAYTYNKEKIADYTLSKVGSDCSIPPQNASLKLIESQLQLVPSAVGGSCDINEFQQALASVKPDPVKVNSVRIAIDETPAPVSDDMARALAAKLNGRLASPMPITVDSSTATVPGRVVLGWFDFKADVPQKTIDNSGNQQASLKFSVNQKRMQDYLNQDIAAKLIKKPGVSTVSTIDFTETSRVNGANGRGLDVAKIAQSVEDYTNGKIQQAVGATIVIGPTTNYTRKYTPTSVGFSALLAQFAQDNPGTYSMAFQELSGVDHPRSATYRGDEKMTAAGIHSLYLGYTDVMEEFTGVARPVDVISGDMKAVDCFKYMFQRFDEGCRKGFYDYFGYAKLASRAAGLGLRNTVFAGEDTKTSANDLQQLMVGLYKNQIARVEGGQKILSVLRAVRENQGIPAGAGSTQIAHVTGESDSIHNDSAVVYSTNYGAFALTVMSDGTDDWSQIKALTQKIMALKAVKIPKGAR